MKNKNGTFHSGNYLPPENATRIRVFMGYEGYEIDAADEGGDYSDLCWTHFDGELLTKEKAIAVVHEFAAEYGRPELAKRVFVDDEPLPPKREGLLDFFHNFMCRLARNWFGVNR
jgi:hypothetical protein